MGIILENMERIRGVLGTMSQNCYDLVGGVYDGMVGFKDSPVGHTISESIRDAPKEAEWDEPILEELKDDVESSEWDVALSDSAEKIAKEEGTLPKVTSRQLDQAIAVHEEKTRYKIQKGVNMPDDVKSVVQEANKALIRTTDLKPGKNVIIQPAPMSMLGRLKSVLIGFKNKILLVKRVVGCLIAAAVINISVARLDGDTSSWKYWAKFIATGMIAVLCSGFFLMWESIRVGMDLYSAGELNARRIGRLIVLFSVGFILSGTLPTVSAVTGGWGGIGIGLLLQVGLFGLMVATTGPEGINHIRHLYARAYDGLLSFAVDIVRFIKRSKFDVFKQMYKEGVLRMWPERILGPIRKAFVGSGIEQTVRGILHDPNYSMGKGGTLERYHKAIGFARYRVEMDEDRSPTVEVVQQIFAGSVGDHAFYKKQLEEQMKFKLSREKRAESAKEGDAKDQTS